MAVAGSTDVALDIFGGLVTDMAPADLPAGVSPDCQDVAFVPGSVKTRPGLQSIFAVIAGNPAVNYLKTYVPPTGLLRLLALDAAGSLWKESAVGVLSLISSGIIPASFGKSASLFTREYLAIGDGKNGIDIPRQFDDVNFDRVSQVGPGAAPSATDESFTLPISTAGDLTQYGSNTIVASPTGLTESGNLVTVTLTANMPQSLGVNIPKAGDSINISGATNTSYNGNWVIAQILSSTVFTFVHNQSGLAASGGGSVNWPFVSVHIDSGSTAIFSPGESVTIAGAGVTNYNGTWPVRILNLPGSTTLTVVIATFNNASSSGTTLAPAGNISAGIHKVSVAFQTRQGYITAPAPSASWTATGGKRVVVSNIPIGPPNVTARILLFTLAGQSFFFYTSGITGVFSSNLIIADNTTTSVTVDFTDIGLAAGISADYLFRLLELGECAGVIDYGSRLFWWGERNKVGNFINLTFDGGFTGPLNPHYPLGWTPDAVFAPGGGDVLINNPTLPVVWGNAYSIAGNGVTATRGLMTQSACQDANGTAIILPNTGYSVRARIARNSTLSVGTVHVHLQSTSLGIDAGLDVTAAQATTSYQEFTAVFTSGIATPPSDLTLKMYADGTPNQFGVFIIENIEIYPTNQPFNSSLVRASRVEDPESYDGVTGFLNISENDGFAVRSAFVIRENLYFVKEHGLYVTQDDGVNEPSLLKVTEVSRKIGTPSVNGVAVGEDWAVIADRTGLYITTGGEPVKISQEIQPTWDRINWAAGQKLWVQVDIQAKRILVGVPLDAATSPNTILMLDYRGTHTVSELMEAGPIHTTYTGKLIVLEKSRKWSPWTITANSGAIVERFDGTQKVFLGNGTGNGKIYQLSDSQLGTDDGTGIPSYYTTYFHYSHEIEQMLQLGSHNKLFTYLSQFVEGSGQLVVSAVPPGSSSIVVASITLSNPALRDVELPINVAAVRAAFKVGVSNLGEWFRLTRFVTNASKHPSAPIRGWN